MDKARQRRFGEHAWRGLLARFEKGGVSAAVFCEREGVSCKSLYRWRARLVGVPDEPKKGKQIAVTTPAPGFIDLGALQGGESRLELRLDLGGGVLLHLVRG